MDIVFALSLLLTAGFTAAMLHRIEVLSAGTIGLSHLARQDPALGNVRRMFFGSLAKDVAVRLNKPMIIVRGGMESRTLEENV